MQAGGCSNTHHVVFTVELDITVLTLVEARLEARSFAHCMSMQTLRSLSRIVVRNGMGATTAAADSVSEPESDSESESCMCSCPADSSPADSRPASRLPACSCSAESECGGTPDGTPASVGVPGLGLLGVTDGDAALLRTASTSLSVRGRHLNGAVALLLRMGACPVSPL